MLYIYVYNYNHVTIWYHFKNTKQIQPAWFATSEFLWHSDLEGSVFWPKLPTSWSWWSYQRSKKTDWNCWIYPAVSVCHKIPSIFETSGTRRARQARPPPWRSEGRGDQLQDVWSKKSWKSTDPADYWYWDPACVLTWGVPKWESGPSTRKEFTHARWMMPPIT